MPDFYAVGTNRIIYQAHAYKVGEEVTVRLWKPDLTRTYSLDLVELDEGIYYLDFDFEVEGTYVGLFYEGNKVKAVSVYRVQALALEQTAQEIKAKTGTINWADIQFLKDIEGGRWRVVQDQMIFYKADNETEIARFNLFDIEGKPAIEKITERRRV